jgi:putative ABC transport system permease protein
VVVADPEYLRVLELPVLRGRGFRASDREEAVPGAVVNQATAERYWPDGDPVGAQLRLAGAEGEDRPIEVVGVVASEIVPGLEDPDPPELYLPLGQSPRPALGLVIRPGSADRSDPYGPVPAIREAVWAVDPDQPVGDVRTIGQIQRDNLGAMRTILSLFAAFAVFALVMASAGLYGVLSFAVARRTRELGIRSVLGAGAAELRGMVLRQSAKVVGIGLLVGVAGGFALSRLLAAGVPTLEPAGFLVHGGAVAALVAVAALAARLPARRATRVDPLVALRTE